MVVVPVDGVVQLVDFRLGSLDAGPQSQELPFLVLEGLFKLVLAECQILVEGFTVFDS